MEQLNNILITLGFKNGRSYISNSSNILDIKLEDLPINSNKSNCHIRFDERNNEYYLNLKKEGVTISLGTLAKRSKLNTFSVIDDFIYSEMKAANPKIKEGKDGVVDVSFKVNSTDVNRFSKTYEKLLKSIKGEKNE